MRRAAGTEKQRSPRRQAPGPHRSPAPAAALWLPAVQQGRQHRARGSAVTSGSDHEAGPATFAAICVDCGWRRRHAEALASSAPTSQLSANMRALTATAARIESLLGLTLAAPSECFRL